MSIKAEKALLQIKFLLLWGDVVVKRTLCRTIQSVILINWIFFETRMITGRIGLHSVLLPLLITKISLQSKLWDTQPVIMAKTSSKPQWG